MWSVLFAFVAGILVAVCSLFYFLLLWNPSVTLDKLLAQRREARKKAGLPTADAVSLLRPNAAESRSASFFQSRDGIVESCFWMNSISSYVFTPLAQRMQELAADGRLEEYINKNILAKIKYPHFVSPVLVSDLSVGSSLPTIQAVSVLQSDPTQPLEFEVSLSYNGSAFICVESGVGLNQPIMNLAVLPIEFALKSITVEFTARIVLDLANAPRGKATISLADSAPVPRVDFELHSHIGSNLILSDLHILQTIFQRVLQEVMEEKIVQPNFVEFDFNLWENQPAAN